MKVFIKKSQRILDDESIDLKSYYTDLKDFIGDISYEDFVGKVKTNLTLPTRHSV